MVIKRIASTIADSLTYGASGLVGQLIGFLLLPLFTERLSPADYGIMAMVTAMTAVLGPVAGAGMKSALFRFFNHSEGDERLRLTRTTITVVTGLALLQLVVGLIFASEIALLLLDDVVYTNLVRLGVAQSCITVLGEIPVALLRTQRRVKVIGAVNVAKAVLSGSLSVFFLLYYDLGVYSLFLGGIIAEALGLICVLGSVRNLLGFGINLAVWKKVYPFALPLVPYRLMVVGIGFFSQYVLKEMVGMSSLGVYNVALKFVLPVTFVTSAVQMAWVPVKFQIHSEETNSSHVFARIVTLYVSFLLFLWVLVAAFVPDLIRLFTHSNFHGAAYLVALVVLIPISQAARGFLGTGYEMGNNTNLTPLVGITGLLAVVGLSYALVPKWQAIGAGIATIGGWWAMTAVMFVIAQRRFPISYDLRFLTTSLLLNGAFVGAVFFGQSLNFESRLVLIFGIVLLACYCNFTLYCRATGYSGSVLESIGRLSRYVRSELS